MGPYPHDEPAAIISEANPAGTDGFECVEFAQLDAQELSALFETMGFTAVPGTNTRRSCSGVKAA